MSIRLGMLMIALCTSPGVALAGRWVVNAQGDCVREWTPSSLARGPLAMVNALTFPGRQLVGGGETAYRDAARSTGERIILVPTLALLGLGTGTAECLFVMAQGMTDFLTGGAFDLVSDENAEPSLAPMTPPFLESPKQDSRTDPCGRAR